MRNLLYSKDSKFVMWSVTAQATCVREYDSYSNDISHI